MEIAGITQRTTHNQAASMLTPVERLEGKLINLNNSVEYRGEDPSNKAVPPVGSSVNEVLQRAVEGLLNCEDLLDHLSSSIGVPEVSQSIKQAQQVSGRVDLKVNSVHPR